MYPEIKEDAPLAALTTLRAKANARWFVEISDEAQLADVLKLPESDGPVLVLGEGSNVLFTRDFDGLVVRPRILGITDDGQGRVTVGAGENWHSFVMWSLEAGYVGLENLALIPGSVGAAPIQNIGAYGVELDAFVESVRVFDRASGIMSDLPAAKCVFSYRDSLFKRSPDRYVVTAVAFRLGREPALCLEYAGVAEELQAMQVDAPTPREVAIAIMRIRRRKLPDPAQIGNAGSFFKNPVVIPWVAEALMAENPDIPAWLGPEGVKLSAAWLLERAGFKGRREGDAGFSDLHALVLVNHGQATGAELLAMANQAQAAVQSRFGVALEPEPRII